MYSSYLSCKFFGYNFPFSLSRVAQLRSYNLNANYSEALRLIYISSEHLDAGGWVGQFDELNQVFLARSSVTGQNQLVAISKPCQINT